MPARLSRTTLLSAGGLLVLTAIVAQQTGARHFQALPYIGRGTVASLVLFAVTGAAAAARLTPPALRPVWPLLSLPAGAVLGSIALTALGFAAVPLHVSLWVVLAAGIAAWVRFGRGRAPAVSWPALLPWLLAGGLVLLIATIPAWRLGVTTIYGDNPDSHQVVGSAVLFQHAPAWGTDVSQPVDVVPPNWRFRYPIIYALAGASNLAHFDPIRVFPAISAVMLAIAALGFAALAVACLRIPLAGGPFVALAACLNTLALHITWHPYYNQLWGLALLPWTVMFGWLAVRDRSRGAVAGLLGTGLLLGLAYPLAALYPAMVTVGMLWAFKVRPPRPRRPSGRWAVPITIGAVLLAIPIIGAILKAAYGAALFFTPGGHLWGGDFFTFFGLNAFVGTGAGVAGALAVLAVAVVAVWRLAARREAIALGAVLALCIAFDVRLRLSDRGNYMDFKHLGYVGAFVLAFAAAGLVALVVSRRRELIAAGLGLAVLWYVPAVHRIRGEVGPTLQQVSVDMFQLRDWSNKLPPNASIRLDIPPSGVQLWAQYLMYKHPVDTPFPILKTTYAYAPFGVAADYVLVPRYYPGRHLVRWPTPPHIDRKPVFQNFDFILYRLHMPKIYPDTSSRAMHQPG
jgi:hypothetical protein